MTKDEAARIAELIKSGKVKDVQARNTLLQRLREFDAQAAGQDFDDSPFPIGDYKSQIQSPIGIPFNEPWSEGELALARRGVDITSGLPTGLEQILSFSINSQQKKLAVEEYYKRQGKQTRVTEDPDTGELTYFNPDTRRITLMKPVKSNWLPTVGGAMDFALEGAGGVAGAMAGAASGVPGPGTYAGVIGGTAAGRAVSEGLKIGIDKGLGLKANPSAQFSDLIMDAAKDSAEAGGWAAAGELAFGGPKLIWKWARSGFKPMTFKEATYLRESLRDSEEILKQYNDMFPENPINMNALFQAYVYGDQATKEGLAPMVQKYMSKVKIDPKYSTREQQAMEANLSSLEAAYKDVAERIRPDTVHPEDPSAGNRMFRESAAADQREVQSLQGQAVQDAQIRRQQLADTLPEMGDVQMGSRLVGIVDQAYDQAVKNTDQTWKDFYQTLGVDPMELSKDRLVRAHYAPKDTVRVPMDDQLYTELNNFVEQSLRGGLSDADKYGPLEAIPGMLKGRTATGRPSIIPNIKSMDSYQIINELKNLRLGIRRQNAASKGLTFTADQEAQVADILERYMYRQWKALDRPDLIAKYEAAKQATRLQKEQFEESTLRRFLTKQNGTSSISDYAAVAHVFYRNDPQAARDLGRILKGSPESQQEVRKMLLAMYRKDYIDPKTGKPTSGGLEKFKKDYGTAIEEFFGPDETKRLLEFGKMDEHVLEAEQAYKEWKKRWQQLPISRYAAPNSQDLSTSVLTNSKVSPENIRSAVSYMRTTQPELLEATQYSAAREFAKRTTDPDGSPNIRKMDKYLGERGLHLKELLGIEWYNNIRMLQAVTRQMDLTSLRGIPTNEPPQTLRMMIRAAFIRPLSKEGLIQTATFANRRRAASRLWYNAVSDPHALALYIKNLQTDPRSTAGAGVLTALGAAGWEEE